MPKLQGAGNAEIDPRKIRDYLLNGDSAQGRHKARVFTAMGFRRADWAQLEAAILRHACEREVVSEADTPDGKRFAVRCVLAAPAGQPTCVLTIWQLEAGSAVPRFVTAYPA